MHCNNGLNNKLVESLVENKVAQETGDLKYLQDSMYDFVSTLKEIILGEYSPEFFNKYVDEALKLHGSNLEEFLKIPKMGLELRQALNSIDDAIDTSNQDFRDNLVLLLDRFQTTLDNMEYQARDPYDTAVELGFEGTKQEWIEHLEGDSAYKLATLNGFQGTEQEWLDHLEGDSAYEIAVKNGYEGSQSEWLKYIRADGFIQSIQQFATNNAETKVQIPDYGTINSLQGYIKELFEGGGLPATPFATKALMEASALVDGDFAMVTDDIDNIGLYVKTTGDWIKSEYDPVVQANAFASTKADAAREGAIAALLTSSSNLFNDSTSIKEGKVINITGEIVEATNSTDFAYSDFIAVAPSSEYYFDGIRYVASYDSNKNFISRLAIPHTKSPLRYFGTITTPSNAAYIRVVYRTILPLALDGVKVNKGSESIPYEPFYEKLKEGIEVEKSDAWVFGTHNIQQNAISVDKVDFIETGSNLFNHETATTGYAISDTGEINPSTDYSYSDFIEVEPLTQYTVSGGLASVEGTSSGSAFISIAYYDFDKDFIIRRVSSNEDGLPRTITTPSNARFARLNINAGLPDKYNRMINKGSAALPYEPFSKPKIDVLLSDDVENQVVEKVLQQIDIAEGGISKYIQKSTNLFNINSAIFDNNVINEKGVLVPATTGTDYARSDFITVDSNQAYYYDGFRFVVYYDANKNFIRRISVGSFVSTPRKYYGSYVTPETAKYVVLCFRSSLKEHEDEIGRKMNFGSESLEYESYGDTFSFKLAPDVIQQISEEAALKNESNLIQIDLPINGVYKTDAEWTEFSNFRTVTSEQVYQMYDDLTAAHSSYITKQNLGTDTLGNEISLYKFKPTVPSVPTKSKIAKVFILCGQHGMEHSPPLATYLMLREMCNNWQSNELIEALRFNVEFLVIPVLNPDGWNKFTRVNENGVDLNRNWPVNWKLTEPGALYSGPSAASELGVQYAMQVFEENKDIDVFMDFHNFNGTAEETQMLWVSPQTSDALIASMARSLVTRMTRHWRSKYDFIPPEPYLAGRVAGGSGAMAKSYAASVGVPLSATFEVCGKWWLDPSAEQHDTIHKRTTMEALVNWVLINLNQLQKM